MAKQPFDPAEDEFSSREALGQFPFGPDDEVEIEIKPGHAREGVFGWVDEAQNMPPMPTHRVAEVMPKPYPGGKDGWCVGTCLCGFSTAPDPAAGVVHGKVLRHISKVTGVPFGVVKRNERRREMRVELEARQAGEREVLREFYAAEYLAEFGEVPPELLPPNSGSTSGPIVRPSSDVDRAEKARRYRESLEQEGPGGPGGVGFLGGAVPPHEQSLGQPGYGKTNARALVDRERRSAAERDLQKSFGPNSVGFGELIFEFNPLTGDTKVTSGSGVLQVEPLSPGVALIRANRRSGTPGVTS